MRSLNRLGAQPASLPLAADDVLEFHAARLMLLMEFCGTSGRIDGLTKMAKLDFFARYPDFFDIARAAEAAQADGMVPLPNDNRTVEAAMVRHHYGPWDKRYYHVLSHLEAKALISVTKEGKSFRLALTPLGRERAKQLAARPSFTTLVGRLKQIKATFGRKSGTYLKDMIYRLFDQEVSRREMGKVIEQ
ncbi:hypothetical protein [Sphingosinicella humi]|uniref:Uncharacterized protein n=1 Tax=Allosphingosinicella humi TaxID=2068657 RepID=A0A2U2J591_9SPHN|nr:hypothetical protein [Sphingosinicella humi]PWG03494.1 hypothetical protein DF286_11895 [Sphingosinicella humi]